MSGRRRDFLALAASAVAAEPTPAAAQRPDAALLGAGAAFDDLERRVQASHDDTGLTPGQVLVFEAAGDRARKPWQEAQRSLAELICRTPATTLPGLRAKARSLVLWDENAMEDDPAFLNDAIRSSLVHDLVG